MRAGVYRFHNSRFRAEMSHNFRYAPISCRLIDTYVMKSQKPMPNQNMFIYILVGDINAELPKMKEIGWEIVEGRMPITGVGFFAVLKDFDGNTINLFESLPRQP